MVQQARRESVKADELVRSLTPRPNWQKLDAFATPLAPQPHPNPLERTLQPQGMLKAQQQPPAQHSMHSMRSMQPR